MQGLQINAIFSYFHILRVDYCFQMLYLLENQSERLMKNKRTTEKTCLLGHIHVYELHTGIQENIEICENLPWYSGIQNAIGNIQVRWYKFCLCGLSCGDYIVEKLKSIFIKNH